MSKQGTDLDLLRQFQIYEAVLQHEDGEDGATPLKQLDETIRYENFTDVKRDTVLSLGWVEENQKLSLLNF